MASSQLPEMGAKAAKFLNEYYRDDIAELAINGGDALYVEFKDLYTHDPDLADDYLEFPSRCNTYFESAIREVDLPADLPEDVRVRITDEAGFLDRKDVTELTKSDLGHLVAVEGQMTKVTGLNYRILKAMFECQRCGSPNGPIPQTRSSFQEPSECAGCERKGPFRLVPQESELIDQRKLKLETPPGERAQGQGDSMTVFAEDDLCHVGGDHGLADRAGERVVIIGKFVDNSESISSSSAPEFRGFLVAESIVFVEPALDDITVDDTKDQFLALAAGEEGDPVELLKQSIEPRIERTEDIDRVLEASVAWLFNAYRIEQRGEQIRGDLHLGIIGDPGTAKSTIMSSLARIAPKCEFRSGGGISKVGLTAAAVQEEFAGQTEWTLEPGILPRGNGGHVIIDEVDEVLDERTKAIHDALEGEQMVKVDKAGIRADLPTRCAVLIGGNPKDGRFDPFEPIAEQLDMDPAFISRLDILLDVTDIADSSHDRDIARTVLESEYELTEAEVADILGESSPEPDRTERPVPVEVFRDWVHYARNNCYPKTTQESREMIEELYLDSRNLNDAYEADDGEKPLPVTPRVIESCIRLSKAFARVELSDTVEPRHVDRTRDILQKSIKLNFDRETGMFDADMTSEAVPKSQRERRSAILNIVRDLSDEDAPAHRDDIIETATSELDAARDQIEHDLEKLKQSGEVFEPEVGSFRLT